MALLVACLIVFLVTPLLTENVPEWSCNFDDGPFQLSDPGGMQNWLFVDASNARHSNLLDGPLLGTSRSGHFLQLSNITGELRSPSAELHGEYCFSLDYYIIGSVYDSYINIAARQSESRFGQFNIFHKEPIDNNLDGWQHFENTITFGASSNQFLIEAKAATPKSLAVDNLRLSKGACPVKDLRECDFSGIAGGAVRHRPPYTLPPSCNWLTGSFLNQNHAKWLISASSWRTKFISTTSTLYLSGYFPEVELKPLGPEDGAHCLSFSFRSSGEPWVITETAINTNVTNVLFSNGRERYHRLSYYKMIQEIDPVVTIVVKINIGNNREFYIEYMKLVKGRCNKPASCDFSTSTCG